MSNDLAKEIIGGWLDGDGCLYGGTVEGISVSEDLIRKIDTMLLSLGINAQLRKTKNGYYSLRISLRDDVKKVCSWTKRLKFKDDYYKRNNSYASPTMRKIGNGWIVKVNSVEIKEGQEVYTIETENHLYVANNILTHNCYPKDLHALIDASIKSGYEPKLLEEIFRSNIRIRKANNPDNKDDYDKLFY